MIIKIVINTKKLNKGVKKTKKTLANMLNKATHTLTGQMQKLDKATAKLARGCK